jgi:site-specific DNA-adenine methylase
LGVIVLKAMTSHLIMAVNMQLSSKLTIASYPGAKNNTNKHKALFGLVPCKVPFLIEPFCGLANFFIRISPKVEQAWLNDKDPEIFALLKCIQDSDLLTELNEYISGLPLIEREDYYQWKKKVSSSLLEQAIKRLIILNCSPNGAGGGYCFEKAHSNWYSTKANKLKLIHKILNRRPVKITNLDYSEVFKQLSTTMSDQKLFWYLDPPYCDITKKRNLYGKGMNNIDWLTLKSYLGELSDLWVLSNRDSLAMRDLFSEFFMFSYITYCDPNNTFRRNIELIISNYPIKPNFQY